MEGFIYAEDRTKLRDRAKEILSEVEEVGLVPRDPATFVKDTAKVVVRLLDTIDHFEKANNALAKKNTDIDLCLLDAEDTMVDLTAKNKALAEYVSDVEKTMNFWRAEAEKNADTARELFIENANKVDSVDTREVPPLTDELLAMYNDVVVRLDKLEGRVYKKKAVKKTTSKKK